LIPIDTLSRRPCCVSLFFFLHPTPAPYRPLAKLFCSTDKTFSTATMTANADEPGARATKIDTTTTASIQDSVATITITADLTGAVVSKKASSTKSPPCFLA
jgi:hypothetical protein